MSLPDTTSDDIASMIELDNGPTVASAPVAYKGKPALVAAPAPIAAPMLTAAMAIAAIVACVTSAALTALGLTFKGRIALPEQERVRVAFRAHMDSLKAREASPVATPVVEAVSVNQAVASVDRGLAESLAAATGNAAANAATTSVATTAGYNRIQGFNTGEGYLEGARKAVTAATRNEWLARAKAAGVTIDESTLPALPPVNTLPVGPGIVHMPTGPSVFDLPRAARRIFAANAPQAVSVVRPTLGKGDLIAGAIAAGQGVLISWAGAGKIARAALVTALDSIHRMESMPAAKSARAQAGRAAESLNQRGYVCRKVNRPKVGQQAWATGVEARWIVGVVDASASTASLGTRALTIDLRDDGTLVFDGNELLAAHVRSDYEARVADDIYTSADLTAWLQRTLRTEHHAVSYGVTFYIPAGEAPEAKALVQAVSALWGAQWMRGLPVATEAELISGLTEGLATEIREIGERFEAAKTEAKEAKRLQVGARRASTLLADLTTASERVTGYALMLGDDSVSAIRASIALLDSAIRPLCDDTSQRAAMLELE